MRILEVLLVVLNLIALYSLRWRGNNFARALALNIIAILILHLFWEGWRWQMVPIYVIGLIVSIFLFSGITVGVRWLHWLGMIMATLLTVVGLALAIIFPVTRLPEVTGDYTVGTDSYHLVDDQRPETYGNDPNAVRELMVQVWYPAEVDGQPKAPYIDQIEAGGPAVADTLGLPSFILNHIRLVKMRSHVRPPVAEEDVPFPVLLFSHGLSGMRMQNTQQIEELASYGYVIFAVDHPYAGAFTVYPDGRVATFDSNVIDWRGPQENNSARRLVSVWADDLAAVLRTIEQFNADANHPLYQKLNLEQLGVFGHSTGGGATFEFCYREPRCKAALGLDPWVIPTSNEAIEAGITQPVMILRSPTPLSEANDNRLTDFYNRLTNRAYWLEVAGTEHFDFTDVPRLSPLTSQLGLTGTIEADQIQAIMDAYPRAFFDHHLRGWNGALLYADSAEFPQVTLSSR